jgi:hypothetical protein
MLIKLTMGLSLFTGIIAAIFIFFFYSHLQKTNPAPTPAISSTPTISETEGEFCGGSDDIQCPAGYVCIFEGEKYLEEGGKCVKQQPRSQSGEGEFCGGIAAIQCSTGLTCKFDGNYPDAGGKCVKNPKEETVFCTQDAQQCPDGSWVGRTGSNCEFVCPNN